MPKEIDDERNDIPYIKKERTEEAIKHCYNMLNYISSTAADIVTDMIDNNPCSEARRFLLDRPEELAVRAYKKVLNDLEQMNTNRLYNNFH